ncbi:MAG TPA: PAS domain S-box protein [Magnetovibrio sp.]
MTGRVLQLVQYALLAATAVLVAVFYFQTRIQDIDRHNAHSQDLLHLKQYDTLLEDEALKTVSLQMVQYDSIVDTVWHIRSLLDSLSVIENTDTDDHTFDAAEQVQALNTMMATKLELMESIKSRTAIVRNTLNFLPLEIRRLTAEHHSMHDMDLNRMLSALLAQNLNPSEHNLKELNRMLDAVENVQTAGIPPDGLDRILLHARANTKANADVSALMDAFLALPTRQAIDELYQEHTAFVTERIKVANEYRNVLFTVTILLFAGLAFALNRMRKAHDLAQRTSRQFRDAVESVSEGFAFFDGRGKLQFWNKTFARLHENCCAALVTGINYDDFYQACADSGIYQVDTLTKSRAPGQTFEVHTNNDTWMLASDSPMADGGTACVRIDITQNKLAEDELRKLSRAVEQSPASVIITDTEGRISYVNPKFTETTGYTYGEAIGNRPSMVSSGERPLSEYQDMWKTISSGHEWRGEFHNKRKDGTLFWELASISPVKNDKGEITHFLAVKEDITERKKTMEELVRAKEQAETASHAKTQFLANMSHELRTPLNAIIGFSEILKTEMFGPLGSAQYLDYTTNIYDSGNHLLGVINDILNISRIETGAMDINESDVHLDALSQACIEMVHERAERAGLNLRRELGEGPLIVNGDEMRIKQILLNLLSNAIKFTPKDGDVLLKIFVNAESETVIQVSDTGYGIPKDKQDAVLEPFEQVSDIYTRNHEGSGLGLYLVNAFVKLHGGRINIDSEVNQGTTVTVSLPAERTQMA